MKIETGYFANWRKYKEKVMIGVVRIPPIGFKGYNLIELAPPAYLLQAYKQNKISIEEFSKQYLEYINSVDILAVLEPFKELDIVLCCFEKSGTFCHRHLLADVIKRKYNIEVREAGGTSDESI